MPRRKKNKGLTQAEEIYNIYNDNMDLRQKEAFLLGRISIVLEMGNNFSENLNTIIKNSDAALTEVRAKLYPKEASDDKD